MRFKLLLILFSIGLISCENKDGDQFIQEPPSTIEGITQLALNTNYVINMPEGAPIRFNPAIGTSEFQGYNFVSSEQTTFVSLDELEVTGFRSDGFIQIENDVVVFPVVFCITVPELEELYGIDFDPSFRDIKYFFGFSSPDITLDEYLTEFVSVDHVIIAPISTNPNNTINLVFTYRAPDRNISLDGTHELSPDLNTLTSFGEASAFIGNNGTFQQEFIGNYVLELSCVD